MENRDFDKAIRDKMEHFQPDASGADWATMSRLLDNDEADQRRLALIKGLELLLVLLVALTFWSSQSREMTPGSLPIPYQQASPYLPEGPQAAAALDAVDMAEDQQALAEASSLDMQASSPTAAIPLDEKKDLPLNEARPSLGTPLAEPRVGLPGLTRLRPKALTLAQVSDENTVAEAETKTMAHTSFREADKPIHLLDAGKWTALDAATETPRLPKMKHAGLILRMSGQFALDWNQTSSSYEPKVGSSLEHENIGFSAGWRVSLGNKRWEVETGLTYNLKSYKPSLFEVTGNSVDGYEAETINRLNFNTLSVPLNIRFYLGHPLDKWNFYLMPGATANMVAFSNYDRHTYGLESSDNTPPNIEARTFKSKEVQRAGVFHGESLERNFYLMASLSLGVETRLSPNASLFVQPNFSYYLMPNTMGIGPNGDQFNTFSLELGFRKRLQSAKEPFRTPLSGL